MWVDNFYKGSIEASCINSVKCNKVLCNTDTDKLLFIKSHLTQGYLISLSCKKREIHLNLI